MSNRLTYATPDADTLGAYARDHHVDTAAPIQAASELVIAVPPAQVWARLTDVPRWGEILERGVKDIRLPEGVRVGAPMTRSNAGFRMTARFEVVDPERELAWTGAALGVRVVHRFVLTPEGSGTRVRGEESMGGRPFAILYSSAKLQGAVEESLALFKAACER